MTPDAVVVGAGAGGSAAAWRLCRAGLKVLLLEAGPRFDPARDYPLTAPDWERRRFPVLPGSRAPVSYGDLGTLDPADATLGSWSAVSGASGVTGRRIASTIGYDHVQGYGGTTLHFTGEAHRLHPDAFRLYSARGAGADWPLGYADLEPYYTECETLIGIAGPARTGPRVRSAPYPLPPHPFSPAARTLQAAGGHDWQPNPRAALSRDYDGRPRCNYCGNCGRGCPLGDKGSADVTFLRRAEATGNLTAITGAQVIALHPAAGGRIAALTYAHQGRATRQETPLLVLAAGAVQAPRLLLAGAGPDWPSGLANGSGQVGRNFMETLSWLGTGFAPGLSNSHMGLPADMVCWDFNAPDSVPGAVGGVRFTQATQEAALVGPIAYATRLIPGFGPAFKARMRNALGSALSVGALAETVPDARSFVDLDPERADSRGVPLPRIHSVLTGNSLRLLHFMAETCRAMLASAGVDELAEESGVWDRFTSTHVFGTCRMGFDAATSVTDPFGRAHDHDNLHIADASVFPSTGGGESPALTIQALALRLADRILQ